MEQLDELEQGLLRLLKVLEQLLELLEQLLKVLEQLKTLIDECKPTYSPREFSSIIYVGAYLPGSVQSAVTTLASQISALKIPIPTHL